MLPQDAIVAVYEGVNEPRKPSANCNAPVSTRKSYPSWSMTTGPRSTLVITIPVTEWSIGQVGDLLGGVWGVLFGGAFFAVPGVVLGPE